ncbi:HD domain-containing phosphohydrolase [Alicyclobacillus acidiphilus]|uniref:HD domain-containing phosphohydrolase n=2 Tax=Alicyclobacillus acidiphilus TaxID=182455 RepID=UPI0028932674|nr:HD domain-containing phosphohydrolase [Alicyclobacillus acidiphilus]
MEVIRHRLIEGGTMGLEYDASWDALECIIMLSGRLRVEYSVGEYVLQPGDTLSVQPVMQDVLVTALDDADFLYVCSTNVFDQYSDGTRELQRLVEEIEKKDGYTASHCERIRRNSLLIGHKMGLSSSDLIALSCGALFHDIGKINIPDEILLKKGRLTEEEFNITYISSLLS